MSEIVETFLSCPYCGEQISVMVDDSVAEQEYTEDCQVCCRPMLVTVAVELDGSLRVDSRSENE
jgi:hypothetical protein